MAVVWGCRDGAGKKFAKVNFGMRGAIAGRWQNLLRAV